MAHWVMVPTIEESATLDLSPLNMLYEGDEVSVSCNQFDWVMRRIRGFSRFLGYLLMVLRRKPLICSWPLKLNGGYRQHP